MRMSQKLVSIKVNVFTPSSVNYYRVVCVFMYLRIPCYCDACLIEAPCMWEWRRYSIQ